MDGIIKFLRRGVALVCIAAGALSMKGITLQECRDLAREHYPEVASYDLIRQTEALTFENIARSWLPQPSLGAQATWQNVVPSFPSAMTPMLEQLGMKLPGINKDQYRLSIDLNQTIWDGGESKSQRRVAEAESAANAAQTDVDFYSLRGRVDDLYFGVLLAEENAAQAELTVTQLKSNLELMEVYLRHETATRADVDAVKAQLLSAEQQKENAEYSALAYKRMLSVFTGKDLTGEKFERPPLIAVNGDVQSRPELLALNAKSKLLDAQRGKIQASLMPKVGFFASGYYGYPGYDYFKAMTSSKWSWNMMLGVKASWNIGAFYTKNTRRSSIEVQQKQLDVSRDLFLFNTGVQSAQQESEIERIEAIMKKDAEIVELRGSVRKAAESKLRHGVIDADDLLRKITEESQARLNLSLHELQRLKTTYELNHTLNGK